MKKAHKIISGKICPYCNQKTVYVDSSEVYSKSYGMIYLCRPCGAWVGVHKGTNKALGRLANKELREAKKFAHAFFDPLWKRKMKQGLSKSKARSRAYIWLADEMGLDVNKTHIGMFDVDQCKKVVDICRPFFR